MEDVTVVGADSDIQLARRITLSAEWARSLNGTSRLSSGSPDDTNAFNAMLAYNAAGLNLSAGYRYVDPLFASTGQSQDQDDAPAFDRSRVLDQPGRRAAHLRATLGRPDEAVGAAAHAGRKEL